MDLSDLEDGLTVTVRSPGLLPDFAPHVEEINRSLVHVFPIDS